MAELAERSGVPYATLQSRLDRGWSVERAVGAAVRSYRGGSARALKGGMNDG
jgi:lambda repressor-like predicted transcriptional regulator